MFSHPELMFLLATEAQQGVSAEVDRYRLLAAARRQRRARRREKRARGRDDHPRRQHEHPRWRDDDHPRPPEREPGGGPSGVSADGSSLTACAPAGAKVR